MKLSIKAGATSQSINAFIQDSTSTTGAGLTGLVFNTSNLAAYYSFTGTATTATSIALATLAAVNSAYSSGGFKEIDSVHMAGWYRLDLPNAMLASGNGRAVSLHLYGAANMAPAPIEIELTGWDNQDAVHGGLSAVPNAAAGASGGLPTVDASNGVKLSVGTGTGQVNLSSGKAPATLASTDVTGNVPADAKAINAVSTSAVTTVAAVIGMAQATTFVSVGGVQMPKVDVEGVNGNPANPAASVEVGSYATGQDPATLVLGATATSWNTAGTIGNKINSAASAGDPWTTALPGSYAAGSAGNIVGNNLNATVSSRSTYAGGPVASVTGAVGSVTAAVTISLSSNLSSPRALDSIADGSIQLNDALWCAIAAAAGKESIIGTSYVVKTPSTGTTIRTFTLDSGSAPTSRN